MKFYLGTHEVSWLPKAGVPLFVSHRRLSRRASLSGLRAVAPWALDSGGFTELNVFGQWRTTPADYVAAVRRYSEEIGSMRWAAPQDWMCEPAVRKVTGLSVEQHQTHTWVNFLQLRGLAPDLPFVPVLQGWEPDDYLRHVDAYERAGVDLSTEPLVGVGTVCRRQHTEEVAVLLERLSGLGLRLHGFGVKTLGLRAAGRHLASSDSMSWSYRARWAAKDGDARTCGKSHKHCANCLDFALKWRASLLEDLTSDGVPVEEFSTVA